MLHSLVMPPPARLGNESSTKSWMDRVVESYANPMHDDDGRWLTAYLHSLTMEPAQRLIDGL